MPMFEKASRFYVTSGKGTSRVSYMNALDSAMIDADIGEINMIKVSSVLPGDIERSDEIDVDAGDFIPCVYVTAQGEGERLTAGVAYGFRRDGGAGYVAELSHEGEMDEGTFTSELEEKLLEMGRARGVKLEGIELEYSELEPGDGEFGCVIAAVVYLP